MASGIKIDDAVRETYQKLCMTSSKQQKLQYCVLKFSDDLKKIIVEICGVAIKYMDLISSLPDDDVRYVCYDFEYINKDNCRKSDIILISWHPEGSSIRKKMICASSFNALKSALSFSRNILEGDNKNEVNAEAALEKVGGKSLPPT